MSLLEEIQAAAVDASSDLGTLLRKCKVLAARLGSKPLEHWLLCESNGYPEDAALPDYRIWPLQLKGHFAGPFGSGLRNAPIPLICIPEKVRKQYESYQCRQSIASIEALLKKGDAGAVEVTTGDLAVFLGTRVYENQNCLQAWAEFGTGELFELLNAVRNRALDFALAVWKEAPKAGESGGDAVKSLTPSRVTQIFNTTVYGGSANLVGTAHDSSISFEVAANDFPSLAHALQHQGVSHSDIQDLSGAVESDVRPATKEGFGPKVSSWIGKMVQKAADGTWSVGVTAAGKLLAEAIGKYYGL